MSTDVAATLNAPDALSVSAERGISLRDRLALVAFLGPALFFYVVFLLVPVLGTIALAFTDWDGVSWSNIGFTGLQNFRALGDDHVFWLALEHNAILLVGAVVVKTLVALFFALALEQGLRLSGLFRGIFLMPAVVSLVVVGIVFNLVLSPTLGLINPLVRAIGLDGLAGDWTGDPDKALAIVITVDAWHDFGIYMFLFLIRIMNIPSELQEAAYVDGASRLRHIWHVTLPLLRPTLFMVVLLAALESLKTFDLIYIMTQGGPGDATEVLSHHAYFVNFEGNQVGYGSSILVVLLGISLVLSYVIVTRVRTHED